MEENKRRGSPLLARNSQEKEGLLEARINDNRRAQLPLGHSASPHLPPIELKYVQAATPVSLLPGDDMEGGIFLVGDHPEGIGFDG